MSRAFQTRSELVIFPYISILAQLAAREAANVSIPVIVIIFSERVRAIFRNGDNQRATSEIKLSGTRRVLRSIFGIASDLNRC